MVYQIELESLLQALIIKSFKVVRVEKVCKFGNAVIIKLKHKEILFNTVPGTVPYKLICDKL